MTLPFDDTSDKSRRFTCFVCGRQFTSYDDFREHIIENHEQGRDYVLCSLCDAAVREIPLHIKVKHPGKSVPPGCQLRATVWRDPSGKKAKPSVKFRQGSFLSGKNQKEIHYRSGLECQVYEILEQDPDVIAYDTERLKVPYLHLGKQKIYIPDLTILFADGRRAVWEIKPGNQTTLPINESKWTAAQEFCDAKGFEFMVLTEVGLAKLKYQIRQLKRPEDDA